MDLERERTKRRVAAALLGERFEPIRMGRFVLLGLVGEGGMGQVHAAYDERLDRRVAIKLLHTRMTNDSVARERMLREARAMARLSHPNVVQVYEDGEQGERAFLVLEFVDGPTLEDWLKEERTVAEIIEAFVAIGRGLAAAHAVDVVHRDFKPANVLFTSDRVPKVADFGLASSLASTTPTIDGDGEDDNDSGQSLQRLTKSGAVAGTPLFMSPEQWCGDSPDVRSDQFSYCLVLYRALYGCDPFLGETVEARRAAVTQKDPRAPERNTGVPRWLWPHIRKGLSRDPADRFDSMNGLLSALLADPSKRRRRIALGVAAATTATIAASYIPVQNWRETERCEERSQRIFERWGHNDEQTAAIEAWVGAEAPYFKRSWALASAEIDLYTESWKTRRFEGCLAAHVEGTMPPSLVDRSEECFDDLADRFDIAINTLTPPNRAAMDQATALFSRMQRPVECIDTTHLAQRPELPQDSATRAEVRRLRTEIRKVGVLSWSGDTTDALALGEKTMAEVEATGWPPLIGLGHSVMGDVYTYARDGEQAERAFRRSYAVSAEAGNDLMALQGIVGLMYTLTVMQNRPKEALWWYEVAKPTIARIGLSEHPDVALAWRGYGAAHLALGNLDEALEAYKQAHTLMVASFGANSSATAAVLGDIGIAYYEMHDVEEALHAIEGQYAASVAAQGPEHPDVVDPLVNLGAVQSERGRLDLSYEYYMEALGIVESAYGSDDIRGAVVHNNIGAVLVEQGKYELGKASIEKALSLRLKAFGEDHPRVASSRLGLGEAERKMGNAGVALELIEKAYAVYAHNDPRGERALMALEWRAELHRELGEIDVAESLETELAQLKGKGEGGESEPASTDAEDEAATPG